MDPVKQNYQNPPLTWYRASVRYGLAEGTAPGIREQRDAAAGLPLTAPQREQLAALDEEALEYVTELDFIESELLQDDPAQPLVKWWWHLGKLRRGEYPAELLPETLQAVYRESRSQHAA